MYQQCTLVSVSPALFVVESAIGCHITKMFSFHFTSLIYHTVH